MSERARITELNAEAPQISAVNKHVTALSIHTPTPNDQTSLKIPHNMSRGGRGGRGGGRGGLSSAARLNSGAVPFDIDEELEREFAKQKEDSDNFFPVSCPQIAANRRASLRPRCAKECDPNTWSDGCSSLLHETICVLSGVARALRWRRNLTLTTSKS